MNYDLLLYAYYPEAIRRRPRGDLRWLVENVSIRRRASLVKGGVRGVHALDLRRREGLGNEARG